jgi:hypothetical protein
MEHDAAVLANGIEHDGALRFRYRFAENVNALCFQPSEVRRDPFARDSWMGCWENQAWRVDLGEESETWGDLLITQPPDQRAVCQQQDRLTNGIGKLGKGLQELTRIEP